MRNTIITRLFTLFILIVCLPGCFSKVLEDDSINSTKTNEQNIIISLDKSSAFMTIGEKNNFTAEITPADYSQAVVWTSSDINKAAVSSGGLVTALSDGQAVITAALSSDNSKIATAVITILPTTIIVTAVSTNIKVGEITTLTAKDSVTGLSLDVNWSSLNNDIANITSGGVVKGLVPGTVYIKAVQKALIIAKVTSQQYGVVKITVE